MPSPRLVAQPSTSDAGAVAVQVELDEVLAELLGQRERPPARLAQVADGEQAEAAVQERRRPAELLEVVADDPVGERVRAALRRSSSRAGRTARRRPRRRSGCSGRASRPTRSTRSRRRRARASRARGRRRAAGCRTCAWRRSRAARRLGDDEIEEVGDPAGRGRRRARPRSSRSSTDLIARAATS